MSDVNWDLVKFKFEILGVPLSELVEEYGLSPSLLTHNAADWKQIPLSKREALKPVDLSSLEKITEDVKEQLREETRIASVIKQKYLSPKYLALEATLVTKALECAEKLDIRDKSTAKSLATITCVLQDLMKQNSILNEENDNQSQSTDGKVWELHIVESSKTDGAGKTSKIRDDEETV